MAKKKTSSYLCGKFKSLDEFGEQPAWKLDERGKKAYLSYMGACLSAIIFIITAIFFYTKAMVLYKGSDVTILMTTQEGAFTHNDEFTAREGFFVSDALTEYNSNREVVEDPKYGELIFEHYGWGNEKDIESNSKELDSHFCSDEELGFIKGD